MEFGIGQEVNFVIRNYIYNNFMLDDIYLIKIVKKMKQCVFSLFDCENEISDLMGINYLYLNLMWILW